MLSYLILFAASRTAAVPPTVRTACIQVTQLGKWQRCLQRSYLIAAPREDLSPCTYVCECVMCRKHSSHRAVSKLVASLSPCLTCHYMSLHDMSQMSRHTRNYYAASYQLQVRYDEFRKLNLFWLEYLTMGEINVRNCEEIEYYTMPTLTGIVISSSSVYVFRSCHLTHLFMFYV